MISNAHELRRMDRKVVDQELPFILRPRSVGILLLCSMIIMMVLTAFIDPTSSRMSKLFLRLMVKRCGCQHTKLTLPTSTGKGQLQQEELNSGKRSPFYAPIGFSIRTFVTSCFGSFGLSATRSLHIGKFGMAGS